MVPPSASITMATPRLEPVETPRIEGPARGLSNVVCNNNPATERAAPASMAVHAIGSRVLRTIIRHASRLASFPMIMLNISSIGMLTDPMNRHRGNNMRIKIDNPQSVILERLYFIGACII